MIDNFKLVTSNRDALSHQLDVMLSQHDAIEVKARPWSKHRSLSQNALFHAWMGELSRFLVSKGRKQATPEWCKEAMKHTFLGYEMRNKTNVLTGEMYATSELKRTRDLDKGEMYHFMTKVYNWAVDIGCFLSVPEHSEYAKLGNVQNS